MFERMTLGCENYLYKQKVTEMVVIANLGPLLSTLVGTYGEINMAMW